jgi:hypothetical protein
MVQGNFLKHLILVVFILNSLYGQAQKTKTDKDNPDSKNIEKYLDDGRVGIRQNLIRLRLGRFSAGQLGLSYERRFTPRFGFELGGYYKIRPIIYTDITTTSLFAKNGIMILANPKYYITGNSMNTGYYMGLNYRFLTGNTGQPSNSYSSVSYFTDESKYITNAFSFNIGSHKQIGGHFTYGFDCGIGLSSTKYKDVKTAEYDYSTSTYSYKKQDYTQLDILPHADFNFGFLF